MQEIKISLPICLKFVGALVLVLLCFYVGNYKLHLISKNGIFFGRMQVEVSKYTEGKVDRALRPNGLPKSLIRYDGNWSSKFLWNGMLPSPLIFTFDVQLARRKRHWVPSQRLFRL